MGPCQPAPSTGRGVGLVALDWQDQLFAGPALSPGLPSPRPVRPSAASAPGGPSRGGVGAGAVALSSRAAAGTLPALSEPLVRPVG